MHDYRSDLSDKLHTVCAVHSVQLYVLRTNDYEYEQVDVFITCFSGTPNINGMFVLDARGESIMSHAMVSRQPMMVKSVHQTPEGPLRWTL